jgi:carbonic anhydrase/acetyltransferase-like protein (isoleucine patch superfamily)
MVSAQFDVPPGMLAAGSPAEVKRPVEGSGAALWVQLNPGAYQELAQRHRRGIELAGGS